MDELLSFFAGVGIGTIVFILGIGIAMGIISTILYFIGSIRIWNNKWIKDMEKDAKLCMVDIKKEDNYI